jgi:hypothetical protein
MISHIHVVGLEVGAVGWIVAILVTVTLSIWLCLQLERILYLVDSLLTLTGEEGSIHINWNRLVYVTWRAFKFVFTILCWSCKVLLLSIVELTLAKVLLVVLVSRISFRFIVFFTIEEVVSWFGACSLTHCI